MATASTSELTESVRKAFHVMSTKFVNKTYSKLMCLLVRISMT